MSSSTDLSALHLFGLRRTLTFDNSAFVVEGDQHDSEPPVEKEVLDRYGARCQIIRTAMMGHAKRVAHDAEEFRHLQARLRGQQHQHRHHQQQNTKATALTADATEDTDATQATTTATVMMTGMTDAWLKQNLAVTVRVHARDSEHRAMARRQVRQSKVTSVAQRGWDRNQRQEDISWSPDGSPTSVAQTNTVALDCTAMKDKVGNPPLAPSALFHEEHTDGEPLW